MSEALQPQKEDNWEAQRRTGRFIAESMSKAEVDAWMLSAGLPALENETYKQWADRTAKERGAS